MPKTDMRPAKKKAYEILEGDLIQIAEKWYVVVSNIDGYMTSDKRHLTLRPEKNPSPMENVSFFLKSLTKFKVLTPNKK